MLTLGHGRGVVFAEHLHGETHLGRNQLLEDFCRFDSEDFTRFFGEI